MEIIIGILALALGVGLSLWPKPIRRLAGFYDTLIHEAGHGLASLPFGAPLPSITVAENSSGETLSSMGYLHQFLPLGLGKLTEKLARILSLLSGYAASFLFSAILIVLAAVPEISFQPWQIAFLLQIALATVLWTLVRITDSPWSFVFVALIGSVAYFALLPWDWWVLLLILGGLVLVFFLARNLLASLAVILTISSPLAPVLGLILGENDPLYAIFDPESLTLESGILSQILFAGLLIFVLFCCRNWLSAGLTVLLLGGSLGALLIPGAIHSYILLFLAGVLSGAGVRSLRELYQITFSKRPTHWQEPNQGTDMVFAAEEIGGDPRYWYWVQVAVGLLGFGAILLLGFSGASV